MKPYYEHGGIRIFLGDCREILPHLGPVDLILTDPPYPNKAGHFIDSIMAAREALSMAQATRFFVFWHQLEVPPVRLPLVGHHIWHRNNTNRPDNYEPIYEFADESERPSMVFSFPVIFPGLTGCFEATGHPTQKSLKLIRRLLSLRDWQTVLDPFAGSCTTLVAAKQQGRKAIGIELEERWCEVGARRLEQEVLPFTPKPQKTEEQDCLF